jgi:diaminopimelate decarboxylase
MIQYFSLITEQRQSAYQPQKPSSEQATVSNDIYMASFSRLNLYMSVYKIRCVHKNVTNSAVIYMMMHTCNCLGFFLKVRNYSLRPRKSDVLGFSDILFEHTSYSKNFNKYYLFCYDLFYH